MLSYQHAFHAGNRADVHKHITLVLLLRSLQRKETPISYFDSHAGSGVYDLESEAALKTREAEHGIRVLVGAQAAPEGVRDYLSLVASFNSSPTLRCYPGSAALARALLRENDRAVLLERHPQEFAALRSFIGKDRRFSLHARDCYEGLPALMPPTIRRGLVLVDPSYEVKREYDDVEALLRKALSRWANAVYLLWYPLLAEKRHQRMIRRIEDDAPPKTLISEFRFAKANVGLLGSGLVVVNTPWHFDDQLASTMEFVAGQLSASRRGRYEQRWLTLP